MEMNVDGGRRWLDLPHAAEYACLATKTIRRAISEGSLPFSKPGRKILVDRRDVDSWLLSLKHRVE